LHISHSSSPRSREQSNCFISFVVLVMYEHIGTADQAWSLATGSNLDILAAELQTNTLLSLSDKRDLATATESSVQMSVSRR
jgi:hypothetical protein